MVLNISHRSKKDSEKVKMRQDALSAQQRVLVRPQKREKQKLRDKKETKHTTRWKMECSSRVQKDKNDAMDDMDDMDDIEEGEKKG